MSRRDSLVGNQKEERMKYTRYFDDTSLIENVLDKETASCIYGKLRDEIPWVEMSHRGGPVPRLIACQGEVNNDGSVPIYRHPTDEFLALDQFSPNVEIIRNQVEKILGHQVNHVLIQYYRHGEDSISEHCDKTLDIVPGTFIGNFSLGAQRTMTFRSKRSTKHESGDAQSRQIYRVPLPHNSLCKMGPKSNLKLLHGIRKDKRPQRLKTPEELAYNGGRISLTFRLIGTYLSADRQLIWGQGATGKSRESAHYVVHECSTESERMLRAFGLENSLSDFDWNKYYGGGFNVLHV